MTTFLLESSVCLALLLGAYYFLLSSDKSHHFNRFYLLFSIIFSLAVPFMSFEIVQEIEIMKNDIQFSGPILSRQLVIATDNSISYQYVFWTLYTIGASLFAIKFFKNIIAFHQKIKSNVQVEYQTAKLILVDDETVPYTFLNYIFVNKQDFLQHKIEAELYTHELVHVNQKHSIDVLIIEFLKTIFWFNPIFILYKKAIQLNHEFIADDAVVQQFDAVYKYQNLLLSKSSFTTNYNLASSINYQVTKKRLIMMTQKTPIGFSTFKKVILLPVLAGLTLYFCVDIVAQNKSVVQDSNTIISDIDKDKARDSYYAGVMIKITDVSNKIVINKVYEKLTLAEKRRYLSYVPAKKVEKSPSVKEFEDFKNAKKFAIWIDHKNVKNDELDKYMESDFAYYAGSIVHKNARSQKFPQLYQYSLYTKAYFIKYLSNSHLKYSGTSLKIKVSSWKNAKKLADSKSIKTNNFSAEVLNNNTVKKPTLLSEEKPQFPGGMEAFGNFISKNFVLPEIGANERLIVQFIVEVDGSLSEIKVIDRGSIEMQKEAKRVMSICPKWIPAKIDGQAVRMNYVLPIALAFN